MEFLIDNTEVDIEAVNEVRSTALQSVRSYLLEQTH